MLPFSLDEGRLGYGVKETLKSPEDWVGLTSMVYFAPYRAVNGGSVEI